MASDPTYNLAPIPKWVAINQQGTLAGGAKLYTYRALNHVEPKAVYSSAAGPLGPVYTNPIIFDLNGTAGPFYWEADADTPEETYYLECYDRDDNLLWTIDDYAPPGGSGGGSTVTVYQSLTNYIGNSVFINHIDDTVTLYPTSLPVNLVIAPGNHKGFTPALVNPIIGTYGAVGPDTRFVKNNTNATDKISFVPFAQADNALIGDVTPTDYMRYQCTVVGAAESYKSFQFPVCQKVKNLNNQEMTFSMWGKVLANPVTLNIYTRQYFGSGTGASAEVRSLLGQFVLTTSWDECNLVFTVPSTAGLSIGNAGLETDDDAFYIQVDMPLGALCDVWFTKPTLHLGNVERDKDFQNYDEIDSIIQTPRTGDIKTSMSAAPSGGWVLMNDGTIGNVGSAATNRKNKDTFQLYKTLWDSVSDVWAPVSTGRGATAQADFVANKTIALPKALGRVMAGQNAGFGTSLAITNVDQPTAVFTVASTATIPTGTPVFISNNGGALPAPLIANTPYYVLNVSGTTFKLSASVDDAQNGNFIILTTAGTGTQTLLAAMGAAFGEGKHVLTSVELPDPLTAKANFIGAPVGPGNNVIVNSPAYSTGTISNEGGNQAHNTMQPTLFTNIFIKL